MIEIVSSESLRFSDMSKNRSLLLVVLAALLVVLARKVKDV